MSRKVCTVTGMDSRGAPFTVHVEASSLYEAAAAGIEQLHKSGCLLSEVIVTVYAPAKRYKVHPNQLQPWLRTYGQDDNVGRRALKGRLRSILTKEKPAG